MRSLIFLLLLSFNASAALYDRGNGLIYDDVLDITWLQDANYSINWTSPLSQGIGWLQWEYANIWADSLIYMGYSDWRLPKTMPIDGITSDDFNISNIGTEDSGHNVSAPGTEFSGSTASEMAHLFYNTLGNEGRCDVSTSSVSICNWNSSGGLTNTGPFFNITQGGYWSSTESAVDSVNAWNFTFYNGTQHLNNKNINLYAWAVHDGDIGNQVPLPAGIYLFLSGLVGLGLMRGRNA